MRARGLVWPGLLRVWLARERAWEVPELGVRRVGDLAAERVSPSCRAEAGERFRVGAAAR